MKRKLSITTAALAMIVTIPLAAQDGGNAGGSSKPDSTAPKAKEPAPAVTRAPSIEIQYLRANDQRGVNVFETPKVAGAAFEGFKLSFGAAFTQQFQGLSHNNTAAPKVTNSVTDSTTPAPTCT
jgi:hypothetical protein